MEPQARIGLAELTSLAFKGADLMSLRAQLLGQCLQGVESAGAMMDMSVIDQLLGHQDMGLTWQSNAFEMCRSFRTRRSVGGPRKLLVLAAPIHMGGNTPVEFLMPGNDIEITTYYPDFDTASDSVIRLPDHDVAFCAAPADAENAHAFFEAVRHVTQNSGAPVLNLPDHLVKLDRDVLYQRFKFVDGMKFPKTLRVTRNALRTVLDDTFFGPQPDVLRSYPFIIRPFGSHAGLGLMKIGSRDDLATYLETRHELEFYVSEFIDYASAQDRRYRKYRIVFVNGKAFPCHMAIANTWDVWYLNSDMTGSEEKRREEAQFMEQFDRDFARRHQKSFDALVAGIGLDYVGIDCAEGPDGNLVVFEADNALIVHDMDCAETFPYKGPHMRRVFSAFETMVHTAGSVDHQTEISNISRRDHAAYSDPHVVA
jgi:glutathione synthase/RimK-type ligase-like ATP-grasp enzyme